MVFNSELDLKAHQVEVHGADMSSKDRKDARRVQAEFEFDDAGGSSRRGRRDRGDREREREPPPQVVQVQGRTPGRRREAFGGHLTTTEGGTQTPTAQPSVPSGRASPIRDDVDLLVTEYVVPWDFAHSAFMLGHSDDTLPLSRGYNTLHRTRVAPSPLSRLQCAGTGQTSRARVI